MSRKFPLPAELQTLIDNGTWPNADSVGRQNLGSLVSSDLIHQFAPEEDRIYFQAPPFHSVAQYVEGNDFWITDAAPNEINFETSLLIGDFGLGSDAPIILNYEHNAELHLSRD